MDASAYSQPVDPRFSAQEAGSRLTIKCRRGFNLQYSFSNYYASADNTADSTDPDSDAYSLENAHDFDSHRRDPAR